MRAVFVEEFDAQDPLAAIRVDDRPEPNVPDADWTVLNVRAASVNQHDVWSLRGVGLRQERLPMIIGCDAAGVDDQGNAVLAHAVVADRAGRSVLSERHQGTFAERVAVPRANLVPIPAGMSFAEASCLPTAWLTAYTMLFERAELRAGDTVLVQGAAGGLSSALIALASAAGIRVWVTARDEARGAYARDLGAVEVFPSGARLPERVDAVMDSVGAATLQHSLNAARPGGAIVIAGGTSGYDASINVGPIFSKQLRILGAAMGTQQAFERLVRLCEETGARPRVEAEFPLERAREAISALVRGSMRGKVVLTNSAD